MSLSAIKVKPGPSDVFTQAFALQYISLILFILIFSFAAFLRKDSLTLSKEPEAQVSTTNTYHSIDETLIAKKTLPISSLAMSNLNSSDAFSAVTQNLRAYSQLTHNHDLDVRFKIYVSAKDNLEEAVALGKLLKDLGEKSGIVQDAMHTRIEIVPVHRDPEITLERRYEGR